MPLAGTRSAVVFHASHLGRADDPQGRCGRQRDSVGGRGTLDIRALPGEDIDEFYAQMEEVIADPAVKIVPLPQTRPPSPASSSTPRCIA